MSINLFFTLLPILTYAYFILWPIQKLQSADRKLRMQLVVPSAILFFQCSFLMNKPDIERDWKKIFPDKVEAVKEVGKIEIKNGEPPKPTIHCETMRGLVFHLVYCSENKKWGIRRKDYAGRYLYLQDWGICGFNQFLLDTKEPYGWYDDSCGAKDMLYRFLVSANKEKEVQQSIKEFQ